MDINYYKKYEPFFGSWYFQDKQSKLGSGNFGSVFKVVRRDANVEPSALKIITIPREDSEIATRRSEGMDDDGIRRYYQHMVDDIKKEYELMSQLKGCNNIVSCEDFMAFRHEDGFGFDIVIRMELLMPLVVYENKKNMDQAEIIKFGIDMCLALERCEVRNIIHRDIKPDNIFVSSMSDFKLGDFGIARTMEATNLLLSSRRGTPNYMAPEVYFSKNYDRTADIYSLGIVLYRMLNNRLLPFLEPQYEKKGCRTCFYTANEREALPRPMYGEEALKSIILRACAYRQQERYQHPQEMRQDLELVRVGQIPDWIISGAEIPDSEPAANENEDANTGKSWKKSVFVGIFAMLGIGIFVGGTAFLKSKKKEDGFNQKAVMSVSDRDKKENDNIESNNAENDNIKNNKNETISEQEEDGEQEKQDKQELYDKVTELNVSEQKQISEILKYKNLEILNLGEMEIEELSFVSELEKLKELNISYTNIKDISPLKKCKDLISLNMSYNNENMIEKKIMETISSMTQLQELDLTGDMVAGEYEELLGTLTKLTALYLGGTGISDGEFLKNCKKLKLLDLQSNLMFTNFENLTGLKDLERLNISVTGVENLDGIEQLKQLKELDISMTDISDISALKKLKRLESVTVSESPQIKKQVKVLKKSLKNCKFYLI